LEKEIGNNRNIIVILAGKGFSTLAIYHAFKYEFYVSDVVLEEKPTSV
jgi:hypothetical protein